MKNRPLRALSSRVPLLMALLLAGACHKKLASPPPKPASAVPPAPAAVAEKANPAGSDSLPRIVDVAKLDETKRKVFDEIVNREPSSCGKGHSLLYSINHDTSCRASFYAVRYIARLVGAGLSDPEIVDKLEQRFRVPRVPYIDVSQAPSRGNPSARVKIVEFADYECSHCREAQAPMHMLLAEHPQDVVLYFKHFPLGGHTNSVNAALGAAAAQNQGKFWPFSDKLWQSSERLTPAVLEGIAHEISLDFSRWLADVGAEATRALVQRDRAEGRELQIRRTPAIFINGRRFSDEPDLADLKDWVEEELGAT